MNRMDCSGVVEICTAKNGTLVYADVCGLPVAGNRCGQRR